MKQNMLTMIGDETEIICFSERIRRKLKSLIIKSYQRNQKSVVVIYA